MQKPEKKKNCIGSLLEAVQMSSLRTEFLEEFFFVIPMTAKKVLCCTTCIRFRF